MEELVKELDKYLIDNNLPSTSEISPRTLQRIVTFEEYARKIDSLNIESIIEIKKRRLTKVSISKIPELNISRKTLYNDKILLKYVEDRIENQSDYFNESKLQKIKEQNRELKIQYDKVTDHLLENSILQVEIMQLKERIEELIQDKNRLHTVLKKYENK